MRREANLWRGAIYCRFPVKVASSPSCATKSPGLVRVVFWLCRQVCCWLCCHIFFLAVSLGVSLVGFSPGYPGLMIKDSDSLLQSCLVARRNCKVPTPVFIVQCFIINLLYISAFQILLLALLLCPMFKTNLAILVLVIIRPIWSNIVGNDRNFQGI